MASAKKKAVIIGAAGRDFHNFNTYFRDNPEYEVVAFTAEQIPNIAGRKYPAELAGKLYPQGIPIFPESELAKVITEKAADIAVFSYSDVPYNYVMRRSAIVNSAGASFMLLSPRHTQVKSSKPVISVCAVRTGSGKSQTSRKICELLLKKGKRVVAIRHPMPYGDLAKQAVQRFASYSDFKKHECTIEEMEEYEPYTQRGMVIYAGVDYERILREAEKEADIILWDGGNNDFPFYKTDLHITVADPHRVGHEGSYYPGEVNVRMADVIIINKEDSAKKEDIETLRTNIKELNPNARIIDADSPITVEHPEIITGKRVLAVEDGPTLTHGEMTYGAGVLAAKANSAKELVDPRKWATGEIRKTFEKYPKIGVLLPAMGYGPKQIADLEATINACDCDSVVIGTPIDLGKLIKINKPSTRVEYNLAEKGSLTLAKVLDEFLAMQKK